MAFLNIAQSVVMIAGQAIGALLCVKYVFNGTFTVGDYVMFGTYIAQLYVPLNMFGCTYKNIQARDLHSFCQPTQIFINSRLHETTLKLF